MAIHARPSSLGTAILICSVFAPKLVAASPNRAEFSKAMASIPDGASELDVLLRIGQPDVRRGGNDGETWEYGIDAPHTLPTLGFIVFDSQRKVIRVITRISETPASRLFDETELRRYLRSLHRRVLFVDHGILEFDPLGLIAVANCIHPLGKEKILALAHEYLRITRHSDETRMTIGLALLLLFDKGNNETISPPLVIVPYCPKPPQGVEYVSRYPIALVGDIPILMVRYTSPLNSLGSGLNWRGIDALRDPACHLRQCPLSPASDPFAVLAAMRRLYPWFFEPIQTSPYQKSPDARIPSGDMVVARQIMSLVRTVFVLPHDVEQWSLTDFDERWAATRTAFLDLGIRWSADRNIYASPGNVRSPAERK